MVEGGVNLIAGIVAEEIFVYQEEVHVVVVDGVLEFVEMVDAIGTKIKS